MLHVTIIQIWGGKTIMKKTIKDFDLENKRVIIRCDLNVPMKDGVILDDTRIKASVRTIKYAISHEAKVILLSHLGKVKTLEDKKDNSLYPVAFALSNYLKCEVKFSFDTKGKELTEMVNNLKAGEVLLVENTRFEDIEGKKESNCNLNLAKYWASLGDIFINDAYGSCHRNHASVTGIPKYLPSGVGFLVEKEIKKLDNILNSSTHPFIVIMGGKKVDDKIVLIERLLEKCDKLESIIKNGTFKAKTKLDMLLLVEWVSSHKSLKRVIDTCSKSIVNKKLLKKFHKLGISVKPLPCRSSLPEPFNLSELIYKFADAKKV